LLLTGPLVKIAVVDQWHKLFPSSEGKRLVEIKSGQDDLANISLLLGRVDEPLRRVFVKLTFKKMETYESIWPFDIGFEISHYDHGRIKIHCRSEISRNSLPPSLKSPSVRTNCSVFTVTTIASNQEGAQDSFSQTTALEKQKFNSIWFPIQHSGLKEKPFKILHDLENGRFFPYLSSDLISKVEKVELIVNGWHVLSQRLHGLEWRLDSFDGVSLKRPWSDERGQRPSYALWPIRFLDGSPKEFDAFVADESSVIERASFRFLPESRLTNRPTNQPKR
jgi:hypothetical protein